MNGLMTVACLLKLQWKAATAIKHLADRSKVRRVTGCWDWAEVLDSRSCDWDIARHKLPLHQLHGQSDGCVVCVGCMVGSYLCKVQVDKQEFSHDFGTLSRRASWKGQGH